MPTHSGGALNEQAEQRVEFMDRNLDKMHFNFTKGTIKNKVNPFLFQTNKFEQNDLYRSS